MKVSDFSIPFLRFTDEDNFFLLAGPCVVESEEMTFRVAEKLVSISEKYRIPLNFNA